MINLHIYKIDKDIKVKSKQLIKTNLANYLNTTKFNIEYTENGKPTVTGINFSISHSKNILVQAFSFTGKIGIDVEHINFKRNYLKLAKRYFNEEEYHYLKSLSGKDAPLQFYQLWTAKEAVCKAQGGRLWFYLKGNYLNNNQQTLKIIKGLHLLKLDTIRDFSLTLATETKDEKVKLIHE